MQPQTQTPSVEKTRAYISTLKYPRLGAYIVPRLMSHFRLTADTATSLYLEVLLAAQRET